METLKKFQVCGPTHRRFGSNIYEFEFLQELGIILVFNVNDLTLYRTLIEYPTILVDPSSLTFVDPQSFPVYPPPLSLRRSF